MKDIQKLFVLLLRILLYEELFDPRKTVQFSRYAVNEHLEFLQ